VPYLTHQDFTRCISGLTDFCDYAVINLCRDKSSSGLKQYYYNEQALDKLLKAVVTARNQELGRIAAFEYEQVTNDLTDYTTSVARQYQRNSIISSLRPMLLFLEIRLDDLLLSGKTQASEEKALKIVKTITEKCLAHKLDGIVIQDSDDQRQNILLKEIRKHDPRRELTLISVGGIRSGE
jgi:hypothetical protein